MEWVIYIQRTDHTWSVKFRNDRKGQKITREETQITRHRFIVLTGKHH